MQRSKHDPSDEDRKRAFAAALSEAIIAKEMTLGQLSARLTEAATPASPATLSYWQNGRTMPTRGRSAGVLAVLEQILEVPQGYLTGYLARGGGADWRAREVLPEPTSADEVLTSWGLSLDRRAYSLLVQDADRVAPDGRVVTTMTRQIIRAEGELEHAVPLILQDIEGGAAPTLEVTHGARLGRHLLDMDGTRLIAELVLPRPIRRGEDAWYEYKVTWGPTEKPFVGRSERVLPTLTPHATMDVTFDGDLPADIVYWSFPADGSARHVRRLVPVDNSVQVVLTNCAPGTHCVQWTNDPHDPEFAELLADS